MIVNLHYIITWKTCHWKKLVTQGLNLINVHVVVDLAARNWAGADRPDRTKQHTNQ